MKASIIINNYNYAQFITYAVRSALEQTYTNFEIVIIDDGSTDNSLQIIRQNFGDNPLVKIISKANGGQLSTFNEAIKHISGDYIFFLDADDLYKSTYIESVIQIYQKYPDVDFIFCALEKFYLDGTKELLQRYKQNQCLGYSIMSYLFYHSSIGGETSTVSMRSGLAKRILPIALESNWTTRADECLTWASSYYGAKKYYIHEPLVQYRIHGNNLYANQKFSDDYLYSHKRVVAEIEFYSYLLNKSNLDAALLQHPAVAKKIANLTVAEYRSQEIMRFKTMKLYIRIIMRLNLEFNVKIQKILKIISHFLKN